MVRGLLLVRDLLMSFHDVAFLSSHANFFTIFRKFVVEVKTSGTPHALQLWLGVGKGMLHSILL